MSNNLAQISEIFQSFQGEGKYIGQRQIFLRFIGCNLSCSYCDTLIESEKYCVVRNPKDIEKKDNPLTIEEVLSILDKFLKAQNIFHSLVLTGGEPLLQVDFLKSFLPKVKLSKYLETNGTLPDRLEEIIDLVDIVCVDFKLPSATKCDDYTSAHKSFIEIAQLKEVFVKAVFTRDTIVQEVDDMATIISEIDKNIPLVLQPATMSRSFKSIPTVEQFFTFHSIAKRKLNNVLVIPQCHKILKIP